MPAPLSIETSQHSLTLFPETAAFWLDVEAALETAEHSVWLSTYIYRDDVCGRDFGERLEGAAARGLDVRLLYDPQGSRGVNPSFFAGLRQRGVLVKPYRPWRLRREVWKYFPRDHGRLLIIDDVVYTGGINWGEEWLPIERGGGDWHDVAVGVRGPCVEAARMVFGIRWAEADSQQVVADHLAIVQDPAVEFIADSPRGVPVIYRRLCAAVAAAKRSVCIENSYCVLPLGLLRLLADAAARGVDVRLLLPGRTDIPIVQTISRGEYATWLACGIQLHEYEPRVMHSKFAVIDEAWGTVGTFNALSPGLWWANETNVVVRNPEFAAGLRRIFDADRQQSVAIDAAWLATLPRWRRLWNAFAASVYRSVEWFGSRVGISTAKLE